MKSKNPIKLKHYNKWSMVVVFSDKLSKSILTLSSKHLIGTLLRWDPVPESQLVVNH